jgi:signal transduction histidine kinase
VRIQVKLLATTMVVATLPVAALGFFAYSSTQTIITDQAVDHVDSLASVHEARISDVLREKAEIYALIAGSRDLPGEVKNLTESGSDETRALLTDTLVLSRESVPSVVRIDVAAPNGTVVASTTPERVGVVVSDEPGFVRGIEGPRVDTIARDPVLGVLIAVLSGPLTFEDSIVGVLLVYKEPTGFLSVAGDHTGLGATGEVLVAAPQDDGSIVYIHPLRFDPDAALVPITFAQGENDAVRRAIDGEEGAITDSTDYRDQAVVASVRHIEDTGWGLVVKIDQEEVDVPLGRLGGLLTAVAIVALTVAALGGILGARSVGKPLGELRDATQEIARGNLDRRARVHARDEIGQLAHDFNRMAGALIEARQDLERKVKARTAALERSNKELESFAYVASHDLQEPLRSVSGFVQLLKRRYEGKLDEQADEYITFATEAVKRMQELIQDLLVYSRVESQGKPLAPTKLDEVFNGVLNSLRLQIEESGAHVTRDDLPRVLGDDVQLGQLIQNLVGNAVKFRKKGATPNIHVEAVVKDGMWLVSVKDDGIGIAPEYAEKVFVIFQRLHRREEYGGTGIGLAVCKKIVERHGGRIWVESKEGEGATFFFTLRPARHAQEPEIEEPPVLQRQRASLSERGEELV